MQMFVAGFLTAVALFWLIFVGVIVISYMTDRSSNLRKRGS